MPDYDMGECNKARIGTIVYRTGRPQKIGRIINYTETDRRNYSDHSGRKQSDFVTGIFTVKWQDGSETSESTLLLTDFQSLIDDHKKKLATHEKTLANFKY